jgi:plasmid stability protein
MPSLTIKGMPDDLYEALKRRAQRNQRSLNGELLHMLRLMTLGPTPPTPEEDEALLARIDDLRERLAARGVRLDRALLEEARHEGRP